MMRKALVVLGLLLFGIVPVAAQNIVKLSALSSVGNIPASPGTGIVQLLNLYGQYATGTFTVAGLTTGTLAIEGLSCNAAGTNWNSLQVFPFTSSTGQTTITANGIYFGAISGLCGLRLRGNTVTSGTAAVSITASSSGGAGGGGGGGGSGSVTQGTVPWIVDVTTSSNNLYSALTASIPCLNATAYNTNSYTTGSTSPVSCDLNSNFYVSGMPTLITAVESPPPMNVNGTATAQTGSTPGTAQTGTVIAANTAPVPAASGGLTTYFLQPTASTNSVNVKATAGQVYWVLAENNSATVNYLRLYNTSSAPTCSSASLLITQIQIPASTSVGGVNIPLPFGIPFSTGIGICVTSGYATTDTTNATATAISLTIGYN